MSNGTRIVDLMYTRGSAGASLYYLLRVHKFNEDRYRGERAFRVRFEYTADGFAKVNTREKSLPVRHTRTMYLQCIRATTWHCAYAKKNIPIVMNSNVREYAFANVRLCECSATTISSSIFTRCFLWYMIRERNSLLYYFINITIYVSIYYISIIFQKSLNWSFSCYNLCYLVAVFIFKISFPLFIFILIRVLKRIRSLKRIVLFPKLIT